MKTTQREIVSSAAKQIASSGSIICTVVAIFLSLALLNGNTAEPASDQESKSAEELDRFGGLDHESWGRSLGAQRFDAFHRGGWGGFRGGGFRGGFRR